MDTHTKFKSFLDRLVADENQELCDIVIKAYELIYPESNVVRNIPVIELHEKRICPHCDDEIGEKSTYYDGEYWYHRPCMEFGPITYADDVEEFDSAVAKIAGMKDLKHITQRMTEYEGDCSVQSSTEYVFESGDYEIKHIKGKSPVKTNVAPSDRTFKNIPKFADGKNKVHFRDWLEMTDIQQYESMGKGCDGKWYGWSHRAVYGFRIGDKVKKGDCGYDGKEYTIKTDAQAKTAAKRFAESVS